MGAFAVHPQSRVLIMSLSYILRELLLCSLTAGAVRKIKGVYHSIASPSTAAPFLSRRLVRLVLSQQPNGQTVHSSLPG